MYFGDKGPERQVLNDTGGLRATLYSLTSVCAFERLCVFSHFSTYGHKSKNLYMTSCVVYMCHRQSGKMEVDMDPEI